MIHLLVLNMSVLDVVNNRWFLIFFQCQLSLVKPNFFFAQPLALLIFVFHSIPSIPIPSFSMPLPFASFCFPPLFIFWLYCKMIRKHSLSVNKS